MAPRTWCGPLPVINSQLLPWYILYIYQLSLVPPKLYTWRTPCPKPYSKSAHASIYFIYRVVARPSTGGKQRGAIENVFNLIIKLLILTFLNHWKLRCIYNCSNSVHRDVVWTKMFEMAQHMLPCLSNLQRPLVS